jgi:hypothetical protein
VCRRQVTDGESHQDDLAILLGDLGGAHVDHICTGNFPSVAKLAHGKLEGAGY